ncbi:ribosome assembly RNA-binding protein YhbY [Longirhabdus pacifica]|uniref:ribosome assembly RNA-binding protein YhbY n=1 Tax=Longirhabdus pacifica TaxID=2305227 RepID=UPI0010091BAA|nr:ribosome assembly RNA-binding protein YhbY [Longirhabdus pacifica]
MLTGKQKRYLRSLAHHLDPIFQVGKGGVNDHLITHIKEAIETRELMKISILNNNMDDRNEVAEEIAKRSDAQLVQLIGKTIVIYKQAEEKENRTIELPRK